MGFRLIIKQAKKKPYNLRKKDIPFELKKKYKPLDSLTTFSAIQELGIWEPFENNYQDDNLDIYDIIGYFNHLLRNFSNILKKENINLCYKNKETWKNVRNDIEDISITLPTCIKMFSIEQDVDLISLLKEELKQLNKYSHSSLARLELFEYMFEFNKNKQNHNYEINIEKLNDIEKKFFKNKCKQGILETLFAKCIVRNWKYEDFKEFDNERLKKELSDFKNDKNDLMKNKESFITLFRNKIKYLYYKYKIKSGELSESKEDLKELKEMLKTFKKEKKTLYVIKTCFLLSEWYLKKYNIEKRDGKTECQKEVEKHIKYLNFAYYISNIYNDNYRKYTMNIIEKKKQMKDKKSSKDMNNEMEKLYKKIEKLCNKYEFNFNEKLLGTYYYWSNNN